MTPNIDGIFFITTFNASNEDFEITARKVIGNIQPMDNIVATINTISLRNTTQAPDVELVLNQSQVGYSLSEEEETKTNELIFSYRDIFCS